MPFSPPFSANKPLPSPSPSPIPLENPKHEFDPLSGLRGGKILLDSLGGDGERGRLKGMGGMSKMFGYANGNVGKLSGGVYGLESGWGISRWFWLSRMIVAPFRGSWRMALWGKV